MKLARLQIADKQIIAIKTDKGVYDISSIRDINNSDIVEFLNRPSSQLNTLEDDILKAPNAKEINLASAKFLPPVARPGKIICLGLNYVKHAAEGGFNPPDYPVVFFRGPTSLTTHNGPIKIPANSDKLDYEGEMAVIIGKSAYCVSEDEALDYVAGYSVFNDGTIRDYQKRTHQWTIGKNFDSTGGFGPFMVTPDELPAGAKGLQITTKLNGKVMQNATTADMIFSVARTIKLMSECLTLEPGDVIVSGTPEGVGYARTPSVYMKTGDEITVEIEKIGKLVNTVEPMS